MTKPPKFPMGLSEEELKEYTENFLTEHDAWIASLPDPLLPPWEQFPDIPAGSMGWKMGRGEDYVMHFMRWFAGLPQEDQAAYTKANPPPERWKWVYERAHLVKRD